VRISTLLIEPVPTACPTLSGTKYSKRSDFVGRVTLRVAIIPILGLVVYTIALLVPSMVQPFNIRGAQEVLSVGANVPMKTLKC
jgi:hypothetical protein